MTIRDQRGAITPAEGCMFAAVALFVIMLLGLLYIAFVRFRDPPPPTPIPARPVAAVIVTRPHPPLPMMGELHILPLIGLSAAAGKSAHG